MQITTCFKTGFFWALNNGANTSNLTSANISKSHCVPAGTRRQVDVGHDVVFWLKMKIGLTSWRWLNLWFLLKQPKTTKSQRQLTSVLDINLTLTLDVEFTLNFGHLMSQPKFNQISTSYDVVCLLGWFNLILSSNKFCVWKGNSNAYSIRSGVNITVHTFSALIIHCVYLVNPDSTIVMPKHGLRWRKLLVNLAHG